MKCEFLVLLFHFTFINLGIKYHNGVGILIQRKWSYFLRHRGFIVLFATVTSAFRFIIVSTESHGNIGYVHYRFVLDHDIPSIYWLVFFPCMLNSYFLVTNYK